jgi:hypothetical protein
MRALQDEKALLDALGRRHLKRQRPRSRFEVVDLEERIKRLEASLETATSHAAGHR